MKKSFNLPPLHSGSRQPLELDGKRVVIVGANGSGKSRFTDYLIADNIDSAIKLSALDAIYPPVEPDRSTRSVDALYAKALTRIPFLRDDIQTRLDKALSLLICEELQVLMEHKLDMAEGREPQGSRMPETKLDVLSRIWRTIFPGNRILVRSGRMTFANTDDDNAGYSSLRLSNGEKAVLYALAVTLLAPRDTAIFVDSPGMFLHPSVTARIWERLESLRPDCQWIFTTHDIDFITASPAGTRMVWVRGYDAATSTWDYALMPADAHLSDDLYITLIGARSPVLFIEGDGKNSIDAKLYPLIFKDYTVRSLGSCDKVVESTRTFNDLNQLHHLNSHGIVDRDRRDTHEVEYLRRRGIFVPEVAEIENILMLEDVVRTVAEYHHCSPDKVFGHVKRKIISMFRNDLHEQALQHTRHRVKRLMEYRADGRFADINALEAHVRGMVNLIKPRRIYEELCRDFNRYLADKDYGAILRVYNQKSMLIQANVAGLCGIKGGKDAYINDIIKILRKDGPAAARIRSAIITCFGLDSEGVRPPVADLTNDDANV